MLPAAPVMRNTSSGLSSRAGSCAGRLLGEPDGPAQALGVADLDGAGVAQRLLDERVGERGGLARGGEVDGLDQGVRPLAAQRLREAGDGAAHDRLRAGGVVPVAAAEPRGGDQERLRREVAHGLGELLDAHAQPLVPVVGVGVERGQPVHAVGGRLRSTTSTPSFWSRLVSAVATPPLVGDDEHARALTQPDAGFGAAVERRPQDGHRDAARERSAAAPALGLGRRLRFGGGLGRAACGVALAHEPHDRGQRRVVAQLQRVVALDPVRLADRREHLRLLDRVDPQIRLQIQIHVQQVLADSPSARPRSPAPWPPPHRRDRGLRRREPARAPRPPARAPPARPAASRSRTKPTTAVSVG